MPHNNLTSPKPFQQTLTYHIGAAGAATFFLHPVRVALNRASFNNSPIATMKDVQGYLFKGAGYNIVRGALNTGLQSHANSAVKQFFGDTVAAKIAGLFAATLAGTFVASFAETPFMRRTAGAQGNLLTLLKFNYPIQTFFTLREFGFSGAVLISKDLPAPAHYTILLSAAWLTASCHKLTMIEATKDLIPTHYSVPDYSKGMRYAIYQLSKGVFTHPALRAPISNPATLFQHTTNVLYTTCGPNMFFWRLVYLKAFTELLASFKRSTQHWDTPITPSTPHRSGTRS